MESEVGKIIFGHFGDAKILDDNAIGFLSIQELEKLVHPVGFSLFEHCIYSDIGFFTPFVYGLKSCLKLIEGKIGRTHSSVERTETQINRIGSLAKGCIERFGRTRRRK
jgi:hypothetical protein